MKTYPITDDTGRMFAFEVENAYIGYRKIADLLCPIEGVSGVRVRRLFQKSREDLHVQFTYLGKDLVVWEPYGDSSRYWIGPKRDDVRDRQDVQELEKAVRQYRLSTFAKLCGDLVSFRWSSILKRE